MKKDIEDYLQEGVYGKKETKAAERKEFLGTLKERTLVALTEAQVVQGEGTERIEEEVKKYPDAHLRFSGELHFRFFKPYKELAARYHISYTSVSNQEVDADIGLVLHVDHAVNSNNIFYQPPAKAPVKQNTEKKQGFFEKFKELFKR